LKTPLGDVRPWGEDELFLFSVNLPAGNVELATPAACGEIFLTRS